MPLGGQEQYGNLQQLLGGQTGFMGGAPPPGRRQGYAAEALGQPTPMNWGSLTPRGVDEGGAEGPDMAGVEKGLWSGDVPAMGTGMPDVVTAMGPAMAEMETARDAAPPPPPPQIGGRRGRRGRARSAGPAAFEPSPGPLGP